MAQHHSKIGERSTKTLLPKKKVGMCHPKKLKKTARILKGGKSPG
jgi:hypothetical protein